MNSRAFSLRIDWLKVPGKTIPKSLLQWTIPMIKSKLFFLEYLSSIIIALSSLALLAFLNFLIIKNQFIGNLSANIGSIEISYVQMAKFWVEGGGVWQPLWYLGYPWHVFYTPVLPALEVIAQILLGYTFGHAYRIISAIAYILVPVSVYLFVWQISKSKAGALIAGLIYTFVPSIIAVLFSEVALDSLTGGLEPRRFAILVRWGEGPHTLALVFLPLFGVFASRFLESAKGRDSQFRDLILAAFFLGLVAMTNAIAMWAAVILVLAFILSAISRSMTEIISVFKKIFLVFITTLGLIGFWYNLPFLQTFFREGGGALSNWLFLFPWRLILMLLVGMAIVRIVNKFTGKYNGLSLAIYWFLMLFLIVYIYYFSGEDRIEYAPQALRLNTEVDLALSVLVGVIISNLFRLFLNQKGKFKLAGYFLAVIVFLVPIGVIAPKAASLISQLPKHALPLKDGAIEKTREYESAMILAELTRGTDQRVLTPGNFSFWLNYFVPVEQLRGALYQSSVHFWPEHIYYQVTNGFDSQITLDWLKIANIGKLVYGSELYGDYKVPKDKFDSVLKELQNINGIVYYEVPLKNDSLAKLVDYQNILSIKKPKNAIDQEPINRYVDAVEAKSSERLKAEKVSRSHLRIWGKIAKGEGVLVQNTYDRGWQAKVPRQGSGSSVPRQDSGPSGWKVMRDKFDFMVLVPRGQIGSEGQNFVVDLVYKRPLTVYLGYMITFVSIILIVLKGAHIWPFRIKDKGVVG